MRNNIKTHYDPYSSKDDDTEKAMCGTNVYEAYFPTRDWGEVTCKKCLKQRKKIDSYVNETESIIVKQMGDFVSFVEQQKPLNADIAEHINNHFEELL